MRRLNHLWEEMTSFDNLLLAYHKARKGKRSREEVARFGLQMDKELIRIQARLRHQTWQPSPYRLFTIYERKPRLISAAPFRDRVVHHALMNVLEPLLDKRFIADTYACRQGHGVHLAVKRYQEWAKNHAYALKLDVSRYFPSIDHAILKQQLAERIKDKSVLWLFGTIIDHAPDFPREYPLYFSGDDLFTPAERKKGLPIGNLTSQFLANLYLDDLDHFIKEVLQVRCYIRYVDDLILLSRDKQQLHDWQQAITEKLVDVRLTLHPRKANIFQTRQGVDVLGYQVFPDYRKLRNDNGYRFRQRLRKFSEAYRHGEMEWGDFDPSVQSWIGHAKQADTFQLRQSIFDTTVFSRE
ncbi:MAG: reverse transcriptase domain-containing protein [Thiolinea sp.]